MKIPKYIDRIITKRRIAAENLQKYDNMLITWMLAQGIDCTDDEIIDSIQTGAIKICEPTTAERVVRDYIKNYSTERNDTHGKSNQI